MKIHAIVATASAAALLTAGCAATASRVQPIEVPVSQYAALDCPAARAELASRQTVEAELARRQDTAAQRDTAGVAIIGVPVGSLFRGDVATELAQAKGEVRALQQRVAQAC